MKVSELTSKLNQVLKDYGDVPVAMAIRTDMKSIDTYTKPAFLEVVQSLANGKYEVVICDNHNVSRGLQP